MDKILGKLKKQLGNLPTAVPLLFIVETHPYGNTETNEVSILPAEGKPKNLGVYYLSADELNLHIEIIKKL